MGMTSPRYSPGGYYAGPSYPDTPIYDMLVNERGTPQIAPIRVPSAYDALPSLAALPPALPALPAGPSHQQHTPPQGYQGAMGNQHQQPGMAQPAPLQAAPLQQAPAPHIPIVPRYSSTSCCRSAARRFALARALDACARPSGR